MIEFYGQVTGHLSTADHERTLHEICNILYKGEHSINTLTKTLRIAHIYYNEHQNTALMQPAEGIMKALAFLYDYFEAGELILADVSMRPRTTMNDFKDSCYHLREAIMKMDAGPVRWAYRNTNGTLTFHVNSTVKVTIKSNADLTEDQRWLKDERLWLKYSSAMHDVGIDTNSGGMKDTYTIPAGAELEAVLNGLCQATFITEEEKSLIKSRLAPYQLP